MTDANYTAERQRLLALLGIDDNAQYSLSQLEYWALHPKDFDQDYNLSVGTGNELAYGELRTSVGNTGATEAAGGLDIGLGVATPELDGLTPVYLSVSSTVAILGTGVATQLVIFRVIDVGSNDEVLRWTETADFNGTKYRQVQKTVRLTPAAGAHTYKVNIATAGVAGATIGILGVDNAQGVGGNPRGNHQYTELSVVKA